MTVDQFWAHVERGPGCWLWTGPVDHRGVGSAKLTADAVVEIRRRVGAGESKAALARAFGVTDVLVGKVVRREIWRHVP